MKYLQHGYATHDMHACCAAGKCFRKCIYVKIECCVLDVHTYSMGYHDIECFEKERTKKHNSHSKLLLASKTFYWVYICGCVCEFALQIIQLRTKTSIDQQIDK